MQLVTQYSNKYVLYADAVSSNSHGNHAKSVSKSYFPFSSIDIIGFPPVYLSILWYICVQGYTVIIIYNFHEAIDKSLDSYITVFL